MRWNENNRVHVWAALLIPLVIVFMVYLPIRTGPFIWDDYNFLVEWPLLHDLKNTPEILKGALPFGHAGGYRPLRTLYQAISYQFFGINTTLYHLQGVGIHLVNTGLFFVIISRLLQLFTKAERQQRIVLSTLGSLVFGLHPVATEAVAFIQASFDTFGITFFLGSYGCFLLTLKIPKAVRWRHLILGSLYTGSLLLATIAFLFYELTFSLPLLIIGTLYLINRPTSIHQARSLGWVVPFGISLIAILALRFFILDVPSRAISSPAPFFTFLIMTRSFFTYVSQTLFPIHLSLVHEVAPAITTLVGDPEFYTRLRLWDPPTITGILMAILMMMSIFYFRFRRPLIALGVWWFLIGISPVMNIIPSGTVYAERYLYISLVGFAVLVIGITQTIPRSFLIGLCVLVTIAFGIRTHVRVLEWTDAIHLWEKEVERVPKIGKTRNNLAIEYRRKGRFQDALREMKLSIELQPFEDSFYYNTGRLLYEMGKYEEAADYAEQAILVLNRIDPDYFSQLQAIYDKLGDRSRAQRYYESLAAQGFATAPVHFLLGNMALKRGEIATAEASLRRAIEVDPQYDKAYANLGALLNSQKRATESSTLLATALQRGVSSVNLLYNLSVAYSMQGDTSNALRTIEQAREKNPFDQAVSKLYRSLSSTLASGSAMIEPIQEDE